MRTETLTINEHGQVTFPAWFFEKLGVKQGSSLTINFDENGRNVEFYCQIPLMTMKKLKPKKSLNQVLGY